MKRKNIWGKAISLLLVISLLLGGTVSVTKAQATNKPWEAYTRITMENYGIDVSTEEAGTTYTSSLSGTYTGTSMNKTYLDVDINFNGTYDVSNYYFHYFGSADWTDNIRFIPYDSGFSLSHTGGKDIGSTWISYPTTGFFNLKILTDIVVNPEDATQNDVTLTIYLNDTLAETLTWTEDAGQNHNNFYFYCATGSFTLRTPVVEDASEEEYKRITMADYIDVNGVSLEAITEEAGTTYTSSLSGTYTGTSMNKTYLDVDINFNGTYDASNYYFHYFGSADWTDNIRFVPYDSGFSLSHTGGKDVGSTWISYPTTGFFNLKIYTDIVVNSQDATQNDVTLTIYLNDTLAETLTWTESAGQNHNNFYFYCATGSFTLRTPVVEGADPENPETPEDPENPENPEIPENTEKPEVSETLKGYTRITTSDFAMIDEVFTHGWSEINWMGYEYPESMNHTYLDVDIALCNDETFQNTIRYLSVDGWQSLQIGIAGDELKIYETSSNMYVYGALLSELGISADTYFNLKLSVDISENSTDSAKKDITLGLWVNQELVTALTGENFAVISGCTAVGNMLGVYVPNEGTIRIKASEAKGDDQQKPIITQQPDASFKKITFGSFDMADGTYKDIGPELGAQGSYILSLNETVFSGYLHFSKEKGADFRYGGKNNPWNGLCFWTTGDGKLYMQDAEDITAGKTNVYTFHPMYAGVQLVDNTFNLKLSTQYVDSDGDGAEDDVKLGVWFNDVLYRNDYIYLNDYAEKMGSDCSVYVQPSEAWITIAGDKSVYTGVDFALFGFTQNWKQEIGINSFRK